MPRIGAHMSVAGGLPNAIARAQLHECEALQIFTKNASQWRARPLPDEEVAAFRLAARNSGIAPIVAHASYLINVATANPALRAQSIAALGEELDRAEALGLLGVVLHPGARLATAEHVAVELVVTALAQVLSERPKGKAMILLEHTAGQGSAMGATFEQIAAMLNGVRSKKRLGVCLDTCHLLAAGYDLCSEDGYAATFERFEALIGFDRLKVFHVNDSKKPCRSRVDRHEHIGQGCIGLEPFRRLVNDPRFDHLPMLIETEKSDTREKMRLTPDPLDVMNLETLRKLRGQVR
ncbi:MAG TPA: deoxyribonuclease IV [Vicinamibacterales bacterium]|nr:deoxyribonuclease IV [Vicinamibacterales bacterium]